jgi:hypothetical protein
MRNRSLWAQAFSLLMAACATTTPTEVREDLDERTGVTVTSMQAPLEFYSAIPELGLQAASFAYLAPLEVNNMGKRETYVWLSVLRAEDERADPAQAPPEPPILRIMLDGEGLELAFVSADARQLGMGEAVYKRPAHWVGEAFYAVTPADIARLAAASVLALELSTGGETVRHYDLSKTELDGLRAFSERIGSEQP